MSELRISTWNCFGMGQGAFDALTKWRAPHGARLFHPDVIRAFAGDHITCVQEILSRDGERFFDRLPGEGVRDPNHTELRPVTLRGSGLGIAGRLSLREVRCERFTGRHVGWDRLARKGTMHVRLDVGGVPVDVMNLHLQAGYDAACAKVRAQQLGEVGRRVEALGHPDRAFVVCGDFNVCGLAGGGDEYLRLRQALPGFEDLGARDDLATFDPREGRNAIAHAFEPDAPTQRIDYIFVRPARGGLLRVRSVERIFDRPLTGTTGDVTYASDHFGLTACLELSAAT